MRRLAVNCSAMVATGGAQVKVQFAKGSWRFKPEATRSRLQAEDTDCLRYILSGVYVHTNRHAFGSHMFSFRV